MFPLGLLKNKRFCKQMTNSTLNRTKAGSYVLRGEKAVVRCLCCRISSELFAKKSFKINCNLTLYPQYLLQSMWV